MLDDNKTIFALATPPGKSGVAVIRVSGNDAFSCVKELTKLDLPNPRNAALRNIINPSNNQLIDKSIIITFPGPNSFTGEDIVELHIHGSRAVINILMSVLNNFNNFRLAKPGEFAKRAFLNGKMDLTAAEGLSDLIEAETAIQQQQAMRQMQGNLSKLYEKWKKSLIHILALLEAYLDFPEEDIPASILNEIQTEISLVSEQIDKHLNDHNKGEIIRNGIYVTIVGAPNVGKSTLLNYLAKKDVAIVSNIAGTTRDVIEVHLDLAGFPVTIADTAGIRESQDPIEIEGIKRTMQRSQEADIKLVIISADDPSSYSEEILSMIDKNSLVLINKIDKNPDFLDIVNSIKIAIKENIGLDLFLKKLTLLIEDRFSPSTDPIITRERHRHHLIKCLENLSYFSLDRDLELACEDLRLAARSLGQIVGAIDVETILDEIFANFCIGK